MEQPTCTVSGCGKTAVRGRRGLCSMHYKRLWKTGDVGPAGRLIAHPSMSLRERFDRVGYDATAEGCWRWRGPIDPSTGYGSLAIGGKQFENAHRASYRLHLGPPDARHVCHTCDNGWCVNPDHLFLGTHLDNMADMVAKGRSNINERNPMARLTDAQVNEIRAERARGVPGAVLAERYGVTRNYVYELSRGRFRDTSRQYPRKPESQ